MLRGKYDEKIGEGLVRIGALTSTQKEKILSVQENGDKRLFGQIAVANKFTNDETIRNYLTDIRRARHSRRYW